MSRRDELAKGIQQTAQPMPDQKDIYPTKKPADIPTRRTISGQFTATGLVINREISQTEWLSLREAIQNIKRAYQWIIGDWMLYGFEHGWSQDYVDMAALTGLKEKTVKEYTSICRNIPASIRMDRLSFGHFQLIAPLEDKPAWIQRAVDEKLSISQLRQAIHGDDPPPPLSKKETNLLSRFVRAIRKDQLTTITDGDMVLMRKAFDRAEQLRKNAMR